MAENNAKRVPYTQTRLKTLESSLQRKFHTRLDTLAQKMKHSVLEEKQQISNKKMNLFNSNNGNANCIPKSIILKTNKIDVNRKNNHKELNNYDDVCMKEKDRGNEKNVPFMKKRMGTFNHACKNSSNNHNKKNHHNNTIPTDESEYRTMSEDDRISTKYHDGDDDSNTILLDIGIMHK